MVTQNTTIMTVGILFGFIFIGLPCLEALSPMGAPMMSPGAPTVLSPPTPTALAPTPDCITVLANVSDCLTFVQTGSKQIVPDKACCPEFAGLLESNPICLCQLIGQAESFGVDLNRALMLPDACKVDIPPLDSCPAPPTSAPTPSLETGAPGSTTASPGPSGGPALSPAGSGNDGSNGAFGTAVHDVSTIVCLVVAIFIAYYF